MEKTVFDYITQYELIKSGQHVGVAVSGGPDSMALLNVLLSFKHSLGIKIVCIHFEHGIRGKESLRDADFVADYCDKYDLELYLGAADVPLMASEWGVSEETAAKRAREEYFSGIIKSGVADCIATAHHGDDNAESVFMHILRGSGLKGLLGIHRQRGRFIRPFLCVSRENIMTYVHEKNIPYVTDSTNANNKHRRNYIRNELFLQIKENINPDVVGALNKLSDIAEEDLNYLDYMAMQAYDRCSNQNKQSVTIQIDGLLQENSAIAVRIIQIACQKLNVTKDIERVHLKSVLQLAKNNKTGTKINLSNNLFAQIEYGALIIGFLHTETDSSFEQRFYVQEKNILPNGSTIECLSADAVADRNDKTVEYFDADKLGKTLVLRTRHAGDVIKPLGCNGSKKLKDYFIDKKMPRDSRESMPLIADGNRIVWIVGQVISQDYCVDENTKNIIRMKYVHNNREDIHG